MWYFDLKILHIISASILLVSAIAVSIFLSMRHTATLTFVTLKRILSIDTSISAIALVIQPASGFALVILNSYAFNSQWWAILFASYLLLVVVWLFNMANQQRLLLTPAQSNSQHCSALITRIAKQRLLFMSIFLLVLAFIYYRMTTMPIPANLPELQPLMH